MRETPYFINFVVPSIISLDSLNIGGLGERASSIMAPLDQMSQSGSSLEDYFSSSIYRTIAIVLLVVVPIAVFIYIALGRFDQTIVYYVYEDSMDAEIARTTNSVHPYGALRASRIRGDPLEAANKRVPISYDTNLHDDAEPPAQEREVPAAAGSEIQVRLQDVLRRLRADSTARRLRSASHSR